MYPFLFPYEFRFPRLCQLNLYHPYIEDKAYLYTNGKVREDAQVHLSTLDGFNFTLDDFLCSRELLSSEADTLTLDSNAPVSERKCGSFGGSASGDWNHTRVSLDVRYFSRRELMPQSHKRRSAILRCCRTLRPQGGHGREGVKEGHEIM